VVLHVVKQASLAIATKKVYRAVEFIGRRIDTRIAVP
jgi:hypothetical protein